MRIEVKRKTVEARCRSDTVEKEDGKIGTIFLCKNMYKKAKKQLKKYKAFCIKNIC